MTDTRTESREVAHHRPEQPPAQMAGSPDRFHQTITMVREALLNPDVNADKAKVMADVMANLEDRAMQSEFNRSLVAAQLEMPVITRDGVITIPAKDGRPARTQGRFARYEDIDRVIKPVLARHNLALRFEIGNAEHSAVTVRPILTHANGWTEKGEAMKLPADTSGSKNATQAVGSATQYGKRYTACAMLNIVTEGVDDDGNLGQSFVSLPYEREQLARTEAQMASEQGAYQEWFDRQSPKDRAWLIGSGLHEQYGGRALPAPQPKPEAPKTPPRSRAAPRDETPPPRDDDPKPRSKPQTAREWANLVKDELPKCLELETLDLFWDGKRPLLDRLAGTDQALWQELEDAYRARRSEIEDGRLV